jgi:hypothetical protein
MNHTKGPWTYDKSNEEAIKPNVVFTGDIGGIKNEADGWLIAAAPELLEVCQRLSSLYPKRGSNFAEPIEVRMARDAIAKATGVQQ